MFTLRLWDVSAGPRPCDTRPGEVVGEGRPHGSPGLLCLPGAFEFVLGRCGPVWSKRFLNWNLGILMIDRWPEIMIQKLALLCWSGIRAVTGIEGPGRDKFIWVMKKILKKKFQWVWPNYILLWLAFFTISYSMTDTGKPTSCKTSWATWSLIKSCTYVWQKKRLKQGAYITLY